MKSVDGGDHWNSLPLGADYPLRSVHFFDARTGLVAGDSLLRTRDGCSTWDTLALPALGGTFRSAPGGGIRYLVGTGVFHSWDSGTTWDSMRLDTAAAAGIGDLETAPDGTLFLGGSFGILESRDSGASWQRPAGRAATLNVHDLDCPVRGTCYAMNRSGNILKSTDASRP